MAATHGPGFVGRRIERDLLDGLLDSVRAGESAALVIRGEAGVGKSALLRYSARQAAGFQVVQLTGVEAEMALPFAGVHQLCTAMPDRIDGLPAPQKHALSTALGLVGGTVPERFLVGLAMLSLLSAVAEERPMLCLIEDAQWLDAASAQVVGLVARRVRAESVAMVVAIREPDDGHDFDGLPELRLEGLPEHDAGTLLAGVVTGRIDSRVADRIIGETRGNPLALLELPARMSATELAGFELPDATELPAHIEDHYLRRVRELPAATQHLMLVAAAEPLGDPEVVLRAARRLDIETGALEAAETAELLAIGKRVQFRHPLVRSAVYRAAPLVNRQRVHEILAEVSHSAIDADRRAWHRALAAPGPDEGVAADLEQSADQAQARGGVAAAAAFLQRAVTLTLNPAQRGRRALAAAYANVQAGAFSTARGLLATAEAGPLDELQRAHIDLLRAQMTFISSRGTDAIPLLLEAAGPLERLDFAVALDTYVDAFSAAFFGARLIGPVGLREIAGAARAAQNARRPPDSALTTADVLLDALAALADDYAAAVPLCRKAVQRLSGDEASAKERLRWLWQGCVIAFEIWDDDHAYTLAHSSVEIARTTGTLGELALALSAYTPVLVFCGDLADAAATVSETTSVEQATGIHAAPYGALMVSAWRGRQQETTTLIETTEREAAARGEGIGLAISAYARAVLDNSLGRYADALTAAASIVEHHEVVAENWGLSEFVEAAVRCGRADLATEALDRLATKAEAAATDWARGMEARARALLGEGHDADRSFRAAIDYLRQTRVQAELARTHLLYGEWLRRCGRRLDARTNLNVAHEMFVFMGMEAFAERATNELAATGEKRRRTSETTDDLTAQERQIAGLARDGLSNPQIGARMFLSPRTVEWHLCHVYSKLGIQTRRELRRAL
ncbi:MAG TPA: AAA family ATPase [Pseudonocardia sp.]